MAQIISVPDVLTEEYFDPSSVQELLDQDMYEVAKSNGCSVITPEPNQLFLDIDSAKDQLYMESILSSLCELDLISRGFTRSESCSKSGGEHRHVVLTFVNRIFTEQERILYQLLLGSDHKKERISFLRLLAGEEHPTRLFKPLPNKEIF